MVRNPRRSWGRIAARGVHGGRLLAAGVLITATGCLQIDTRVTLQTDGSATITERVQLSRHLLDLGRMRQGGVDFETYLGKEHILKRVAEMGAGATLVAHEVRGAAQGARECVSVFTIPDINQLSYVSPFLDLAAYPKHTVLKFSLWPCVKPASYGLWPGQMVVSVGTDQPGKAFQPLRGERADVAGRPAGVPRSASRDA